MHLRRWIILGGAVLLPSCFVYNQDLIDSARGGDEGSGGSEVGSGGKGSGGIPIGDGDGDGDSGGTDMGGESSGGAANSGGDSGDGDSGGSNSGGSGGGNSGGNGSGGGPVVCSAATAPCLVDDLEHKGSASYSSQPFYGKWDRYIQAGGTWSAATSGAMVVVDPDDSENAAFRIAATGLDDWGLGVFLTLKNGGEQDLSGFTGISFRARSTNTEATINVAIGDVASHRDACLAVASGVDCDKHMRSIDAPTYVIDNDWQLIELELSSFVDKDVDAVPRTANLTISKVYSLHFQVQTVGTAADFYVDDVTLY